MKKFIVLILSIFVLWGCDDSSTTSTDVCKNITCDGNGSCVNLSDKPACVCNEGFVNKTVSGVPTCVEMTTNDCGGATCEGWQECVSDACVTKSGNCKDNTECTDANTYCDTSSHTCKDEASNPCADVTCSDHGDCIANGDTPICICEAGYTAQGTDCIAQEDPCADIKCTDGVTEDSHGTCVASGQTPVCICSTGYKADGATKCVEDSTDLCADVICSNDWQECKEGDCVAKDGKCDTNGDCVGNTTCNTNTHLCETPSNPCEAITCTDGVTEVSHGTCLVNNDAALCFCNDGYHTSDDHVKCLANDPCQFVVCDQWETCSTGICEVNDGKCNVNGDCVGNNVYCDSADHTCKENSGGDNVCTDITCTDGETEDSHGICFDANGTATCSCNAGYYRPNDDSTKCLPINDLCADITCSDHGTCAVVNEQPVCACEAGYVVDGLNCNEDKCYGVTCDGHGVCAVVNGVSQCNCADGYKADGLHCFDTCFNDNECNDGLYCNGVETCVDYPDDNTSDHFCKSGEMVDCHQNDDQYSCLAAAYCDEATDSCKYELPDVDEDDFYDANCSTPTGMTGTDCNDNDEDINFSTPEACNFVDDNCNDTVDEGITYSNSTDKRLTYQDSNSGCTSADVFGTTTCGAANYSTLWSNDEFLNVWIDQRDGNDQIYFGRYNLAGSLIGSEIQVTVTANTTRKTLSQFAIAADSTNQKFMLIWVEGGQYLKYVFINRYGAKLSSPVTIYNAGGAFISWHNTSVIWGDNRFIVGFIRNYRDCYSNRCYRTNRIVSFISNSGEVLLAPKTFASEAGGYYDSKFWTFAPTLTWTGTDILYSYYRNDGSIRLDRLSKETGASTLNKTFISSVNNSIYTFHWKKVDDKDTFFLATKHSDNNIKVSRYDHRYDRKNITNVIGSAKAWNPSMVWTGNQYVISFSDDTNNDGNYDIFLARVDTLGNVSQMPEKASNDYESGEDKKLNYFPRIIDRDKKFSLFFLSNNSDNWELYLDNITCGN